jgi:6-pyruvoyltetrahydropterin/6-carboxytetrahydropterin synthase
MYTVSVRKDFIARHALTGGDWGAENDLHSHHYVVEVRLEGLGLDQHGYLVDIDDVNAVVQEIIETYREKKLNDLKGFENRNPSLERFARIIQESVAEGFKDLPLRAIAVRLWENDLAWAEYRETY